MSLIYKIFKIKITADDHIEDLVKQTPEKINIQMDTNKNEGYIISIKTKNETRQLGLFRSVDLFGFSVLTPYDETRALNYASQLVLRLKDKGYDPKINDISSDEYFKKRTESLEKIASLYSKLTEI